MIIDKLHLDFSDLNILPCDTSNINSRIECTTHYDDGMLPLFAAPMDTVIDRAKNLFLFSNEGIHPIIPRERDVTGLPEKIWLALSLDQFNHIFLGQETIRIYTTMFVCIDIANGHMKQLWNAVEAAKNRYGDTLVLMVGNVANYQTYGILSEAGADYIRMGIGSGAGCLTTVNTGVGYPMASLINDTYEMSATLSRPAKIVADGGMQRYDDIIKALALGADYVMVGSIFNKALESAGTTYNGKGQIINQYDPATKEAFKAGAPFTKDFRGMSTKDVQRSLGRTNVRSSEGVYRRRDVEYTLDGWVENFKHYLSTAMSYAGAKTLEDFVGKADLIRVSENSVKRVNK